MKKRYSSIIVGVMVLVVFIVIGCYLSSASVFADGAEGTGGGGGSGAGVDCSKASYFSVSLCYPNVGAGGASWHIFKTKSSYRTSNPGKNLYIYDNKLNGPRYDVSNILTDAIFASPSSGGYDRKLARTCPSSKYDYYFAFVWDGWNGRSSSTNNILQFPSYYGPFRRGGSITLNNKSYKPDYNTVSNRSKTTIEAARRTGSVNGWRVSDATALSYYNEYLKSVKKKTVSNFPSSIGYFCVANRDEEDSVYLAGVAVDKSYNELGPQYNSEPCTTEKGGDCTISKGSTPSGYKFVGWSESYGGNPSSSSTTFSKKRMKESFTAYAVYEKDGSFTLTGVAVNENGSPFGSQYDPNGSPCTKKKGETCTITTQSVPDYEFKRWSASPTGPALPNGTNASYSRVMQEDVTVYAIYEPTKNVTLSGIVVDKDYNELGLQYNPASCETMRGGDCTINRGTNPPDYQFIGWSEVKGGTPSHKDWSTFTKTKMQNSITVYIVYDDMPKGCEDLVFVPTSYTNSNEKNGTTSTKTQVRNLSLSGGWEDTVYAKPTDTVNWIHCYYPGVQKVDYNQEVTIESSHKPSYWSRSENPIDCSEWSRSCTEPSGDYHLNNMSLINAIYSDSRYRVRWENKFKASRIGFVDGSNGFIKNDSYGNGDSEIKEYQNAYTISISAGVKLVGQKDGIVEKSESGTPRYVRVYNPETHKWNCEWGLEERDAIKRWHTDCTTDEEGNVTCETVVDERADRYRWQRRPDRNKQCTHPEQYIGFTADPNIATYFANVLVPYNYKSRTELNEEETKKKKYYAGEKVTVKSSAFIDTRENGLTGGDYATVAREVKRRIEVCVEGKSDCYYTDPKAAAGNGVLNPNGLYNGTETGVEEETELNVLDLSAGTKMCIRSGLFPKDSGEVDNNMDAIWSGYDINNKDHWAWSEPICVRVLKRPSIQVLGGGVFSGGDIVASLGTKRLIYGYYDENDASIITGSKKSTVGERVFGSWGELGVTSRGSVEGFASGAALGYYVNVNGVLSPDPFNNKNNNLSKPDEPGGNSETDYCKNMGPLTIAGGCNGSRFAGFGSSGSINGIKMDLSSLANMASGGKEVVVENKSEIGATGLNKGEFKVITSGGDITIKGDIISQDSGFSTFYDIPKLLIYTTGNIKIDCGVTRIDAVLAANGVVTTCKPEGDWNDDEDNLYDNQENRSEYANQLVVNGAIVASKLNATRTYGAAKGANTIVPAELINFDPTLLKWNVTAADAEEKSSDGTDGSKEQTGLTGELTVTYINELAPRY